MTQQLKEKFATVVEEEVIQQTVEALENNGFSVEVVDTLEEAKEAVLERIPKGSEVFTNTSVTTREAGITDAINGSGDYKSVRAEISKLDMMADGRRITKLSATPDYMVGSVHALTQDGHALIASRTGSQLPGYVAGARQVIWVVGGQKIVPTVDEGIDRLREYVLPLESERINELYKTDVGSHIDDLLVKYTDSQNRIHVVIVREAAGF